MVEESIQPLLVPTWVGHRLVPAIRWGEEGGLLPIWSKFPAGREPTIVGAVTQKENENLVEANKGKTEWPKIAGTSGQSEFEQK